MDRLFNALQDHPQCSEVAYSGSSTIILYVHQLQLSVPVTIEAATATTTVEEVKNKAVKYMAKGEYAVWIVFDKSGIDEEVLKFLTALNFGKLYYYKSDTRVSAGDKVLDLVSFKPQVRKKYFKVLPMAGKITRSLSICARLYLN